MLRIIIVLLAFNQLALAQQPWEATTYPDEQAFLKRMQPMTLRIANQGFGERSLSVSKCPDTGLPVRTWALEGEVIYSPYTGRAYLQGPTGYFGPKARNERGEIIAFGGDPLKYDLSPAAATLLNTPKDPKAMAFLTIPGNLRQQYHFACSNWARAFPLIGDQFSDSWKAKLFYWIGEYEESRRPSDGGREHTYMSHPHNLVGEEGELLGGNPFDGGTENHKTMWRTSALLYSQLLPDTAKISGYSTQDTERITKAMLRDYLKRMLIVGNGEYDSDIYYPYTIKSFLNLYDFSPDEETRELAKFALDLFFATYGLKVMDGMVAGPQKRGYLSGENPGMMEIMQWVFFNNTSRKMDEVVTTLHQATTTYRPNEIIWNITRKNLDLPFEARISHPFYHMDQPHAFAESFYCSRSFAIGNTQMTIVDNPNQQMVWSLIARGENGPLCFSGGHPMRQSTSGHSPYTQTLHAKGALLLLTAPTKQEKADTASIAKNYKTMGRNNLWIMPRSEQPEKYEVSHRQKYAQNPLHKVKRPDAASSEEISAFWNESVGSAASWFYFPRSLKPMEISGNYYFDTPHTLIALLPVNKHSWVLNPESRIVDQLNQKGGRSFFRDYGVIVVEGELSGFVVQAVEKSKFRSMEEFARSVEKSAKLRLIRSENPVLKYSSLEGDDLELHYRPEGLRCEGKINGVTQDWDNYTNGAVYESPYLKISNGHMFISDGTSKYSVDFKGERPVWLNE